MPFAAALPRACTKESHERLRRPSVWPTLPLVGVMVTPADEDEPEERLELRNTECCGSTLAVAVPA